ncbi:L-threonine 3-dehydrogenase (TDH) [Durusdinium trenchii]|uniref:alcohol dehydrogenase n=2 Tax=Durusdinium trenchii TaxID=1381693 RepID=A0ABP0ILL5_9DINO
MYAFRKPFTAASFTDVTIEGWSFKTILITTQVAGYMLSKFIGIKVVSEMPPARRATAILLLIGCAEVALVFFGLIPPPWNAVCLFFNGLPLGMVFGLVLGFLEGRRLTEALTAGLCASFIVADGFTKTVGTWLMEQGVSQYWMPAATGGVFLLPLAICVWMLRQVPQPTEDDVAERAVRARMQSAERRELLQRHFVGIVAVVLMYVLVTIVRSIRADFAPALWAALGEPAAPSTFTRSELWVALGVMVVNGLAATIRDNRTAFRVALLTCGSGFAIVVGIIITRSVMPSLGAFPFMVLVGLGLYLPYVAVHTTIFERMLAMTRDVGTVGFLMYLADSFGYLGYVLVMLSRGEAAEGTQFLLFFDAVCWAAAIVSLGCLAICWTRFQPVPTPSVLGHEIVGQIEEFGADASRTDCRGQRLNVGDRVVWALVASCGECLYCQRGLPQKCVDGRKYGHLAAKPGDELHGGLAGHCLLLPGTAMARIPESLPLEVACPTSCATATVAAAFRSAGRLTDRRVCLLGMGMLGLTAAAMADAAGASEIVCVDPNIERCAIASRFGATKCVAPAELLAVVSDIDEDGFDVLFDFSGANEAVTAAWPLLRTGGTVVLVGAVFPGPPLEVPMEQIVRRWLTIRGVHNYSAIDLVQAIEFLEQYGHAYPFQDLVGEWFALEAIEEAFARAKEGTSVRIGVRP